MKHNLLNVKFKKKYSAVIYGYILVLKVSILYNREERLNLSC